MRIEKWQLNGKEVDIRILDKDEIEKNTNIEELEETKDLSKDLEQIGGNNG